jgi:hypothetical protein
MQALAENASRQSRVYLTGGSSAVLLGVQKESRGNSRADNRMSIGTLNF